MALILLIFALSLSFETSSAIPDLDIEIPATDSIKLGSRLGGVSIVLGILERYKFSPTMWA